MTDDVLSPNDRGLPERAIGMRTSEFLATKPRIEEFWTPLVVLDDTAMNSNLATMAAWCGERDFDIYPHGKTTMAPALWQRHLDAGAAGITLATVSQVRVGRAHGLASIMLANSMVDPRSLAWLARELDDPDFRFTCWADSLTAVDIMESALREARPARPVNVCVELGAPGGRTGARTVAEAVRIAERIAASDVLRLAGVSGYEGVLGSDRSERALTAVRAYIAAQLELHAAIGHLYDEGEVIVTMGGSAYFDLAAEAWAGAPRDHRTRFALRSGAYLLHDDGFYRRISPFDGGAGAGTSAEGNGAPRFRTAMHGYARVLSHPEPGLSFIDGGKRDFPYDLGTPAPRAVADDLGGPWTELDGEIPTMSDQHSYLRSEAAPPVSSVVRLGLSHPCTAFDKWRLLPVVDSAESGIVIELVRTYF